MEFGEQLSKAEITKAVQEGISQGLLQAFHDGKTGYAPNELMFDAVRVGVAEAFGKFLEKISTKDLLGAVESGVENRK